jgi:hypothetical protein
VTFVEQGRGAGRLGSVLVGRVFFTSHVMPAVRLVNHLVDGTGQIIFRNHEGAVIVGAAEAGRGGQRRAR